MTIRLLSVGMPHSAPDPRGLRVWLSTGAHHLNGDRSPTPAWHAGRSYLDRDLHRGVIGRLIAVGAGGREVVAGMAAGGAVIGPAISARPASVTAVAIRVR